MAKRSAKTPHSAAASSSAEPAEQRRNAQLRAALSNMRLVGSSSLYYKPMPLRMFHEYKTRAGPALGARAAGAGRQRARAAGAGSKRAGGGTESRGADGDWSFGHSIHVAELGAFAGSLDILLVSTAGRAVSKLIRLATWSEYDHVMLLRRSPASGRLSVVEAVRGGVTEYGIEDFLRDWVVRGKYNQVGYRKLSLSPAVAARLLCRPRRNSRRDPQPTLPWQKLDLVAEEFSRLYVGNRFGLRGIVTQHKRSVGSMVDDGEPRHPELRTFFCSELVAAALNRAGLLRADISEGSFVPRSFAASNPSWLADGASLSPIAKVDPPTAKSLRALLPAITRQPRAYRAGGAKQQSSRRSRSLSPKTKTRILRKAGDTPDAPSPLSETDGEYTLVKHPSTATTEASSLQTTAVSFDEPSDQEWIAVQQRPGSGPLASVEPVPPREPETPDGKVM